ncbi:hypothetical protein Ndes2526B_g08024 [Nannochloris sp. 'desiccata']|nr:hypothetical protein KSW81_002668 [Chlorella desiccata (nom. nud.)]
MAKQSGRETRPIDVSVFSTETGDSWKGTPLDDEEEQLKAEPTATASTDDGDKASPPVDKEEYTHVEEANKVEDTSINNIDKVNASKTSPSSRACSPIQKELEAFQKSPPPPCSPAAAASSREALSPKSTDVGDFVPVQGVESAVEKEAGVTAVSLPPSPPPIQLLVPAADTSIGARKELEDAIQRIETHIKTEQAARRAAEGALAQARQQQSQDVSPATQLLSTSSIPTVSNAPCASELQVALEDLANAQLAVQRAHTVVANILSQQQQQQPRTSNKIQTSLSIKENKDALPISPGIRHSAAMSLLSSPPPLLDCASTSDMPCSPTLTKVITKDRGMSWVAVGPKRPPTKQNWTTPNLKVKAGVLNDTLDGSNRGGRSPTPGRLMNRARSPRGPFKKKELTNLPSSPKSGTPLSNKRSDSGMSPPTRGGGGGGGGHSSTTATTEWNNDRFATGKAEAFMLSQASRWNSNQKGK